MNKFSVSHRTPKGTKVNLPTETVGISHGSNKSKNTVTVGRLKAGVPTTRANAMRKEMKGRAK
jgi:hypothetical protein